MKLTIKQLRDLIKEALDEDNMNKRMQPGQQAQAPVKQLNLKNPNGGSTAAKVTGNLQSHLVVFQLGDNKMLLEPGDAQQLGQALSGLGQFMGMK